MSGSFCIVATEYTMAAQEIYKESATLPSNRSAETAAVTPYRRSAHEHHWWREVPAVRGSFNFWQFSGLDAEVHSAGTVKKIPFWPLDFRVVAHYSGRLFYTKKAVACGSIWPRPCKTQELGDDFWGLQQDGQRLMEYRGSADASVRCQIKMMKFLRWWGLGFLWGLMRRCTLSSWRIRTSWGRFQRSLSFAVQVGISTNTKLVIFQKEDFKYVTSHLGIHKDKTKLLQDCSKLGSLPGKEQTGRTDSPFLTTQSWRDLGGKWICCCPFVASEWRKTCKVLGRLREREGG